MHQQLIRHGETLAVVIDPSLLEELQITPETPLELTASGDAILIRPVREAGHHPRLDAALSQINAQFADDLRRLAE